MTSTPVRTPAWSAFGGLAVIALGAAVLCGWTFDVAVLRGPVAGQVEMKANTAVAFVLCGASLLALTQTGSPAIARAGRVMALLAAAIGAVTLAEYAAGANLGLDELLFDDPPEAAQTVHPGRLAPQTAATFVLAGVALEAIGRGGHHGRRIGEASGALMAAVGFFGLLGYAYGARPLSTVGGFTPIALHTALGFLVLAASICVVDRDATLRHMFCAESVGAAMARRLLPVFVIGVPAAGWLRLEGERAGLYGADTGVALMVLAFLVTLAIGVAISARVLDRGEQSQRRATSAQERLAAIVESSSDAIVGTTLEGDVTSWNAGAQKLYGHAAADMIGRSVTRLAPPDRPDELGGILRRIGRGERVESLETARRTKDGRDILVSLTASPIRDASGVIVGASEIARDITEVRRMQEDLAAARAVAQQAARDALTGLPNRALFLDRLEMALAACGQADAGVAVLFVDLDAFKRINDSLGHHSGDRILVAVADRLTSVLRADATASRLGGDEFTVLCPRVRDTHEACLIAERIGHRLSVPIDVDGVEVVITASIGIALAGDGDPADLAVRKADAAMYAAKREGGARHRVFADDVRLAPAETLGLEADLRHALPDQLRIAYQPQVDLRDGTIVGAEALLRWRHPERGLIPPSEFIPLAESSGLILSIGAWVLDEALQQLARWDREHPAAGELDIAVNLSPRQVRDAALLDGVRASLDRTGIAPQRLHLEITETVLLEDTREHLATLHGLRDLGVRLVLDDFGTGWSSLSYLKRFPVDVVKIDRSFVSGLPGRRDDVAIVTAVLGFADALGLRVVAEGVETDEHVIALRAMGCTYAQGFHLGRPAAPAEIARMLALAPRAVIPATAA